MEKRHPVTIKLIQVDNICINRTNGGSGYVNHLQILTPSGKIASSILLDKNGSIISYKNLKS